MRVYLPATPAMLLSLVESESMPVRSGIGFALTPALRESFVAGDDEELTEVAIAEAARASLRLLAGEHDDETGAAGEQPGLPLRRAVITAEVDDVTLRPDLDDAVVKLAGPLPLSAVIAVQVDGADAEAAVARALPLIDAADLGDEDAELAVGDAADHDLAWYAPQELPFLLELL